MTGEALRRAAARILCMGLLALCAPCLLAPGAALGAADDPLFVFTPMPPKPFPPPPPPPIPPPAGYFEGPCGLAVDAEGNIYVSDYYPEEIADHDAVDVFGPNPLGYPYDYRTQIPEVDQLDGPCGLAVDGAGTVFVNDYHRAVFRYETSEFPPPPLPPGPVQLPLPEYYGGPTAIDTGGPTTRPTGVALDAAAGRLYVDNRAHVSVYDSTGAPLDSSGGSLEEGEEQLRIGAGPNADSIEDGYGLAVSAFPATAGRLYVPDAADDVVEVYDPAVDLEDPVAVIDGHEVPGGFVSLRDAAVAVDRVTGKVYVADNLEPAFIEHPEAAVYVFDASGTYLGRLKHNVVDALPPGLAVDNSEKATQGRVYVTSGDVEFSSVYAYGPGAETSVALPPLPPPTPAGSGGLGSASSRVAGPSGGDGPLAAASAKDGPALAQKGDLRVAVEGAFAPRALPRRGAAPISVRVGGRIFAVNDGELPQLKTMRIEFNRNGRMQVAGLPACRGERIRIASSARALATCRPALLGTGSFAANVVLAGQDPYPTRGRLLLFNAGSDRRPALIGHIYAAKPFATSFLIPFRVSKGGRGTFGTTITASLPQALGNWGYVTAIELKMFRTYRYRGARRSFLSAGCPAPAGFPGAVFPLARTSFGFAGGTELGATLTRSCRVR
jgi:hypothetical protein